MSNSPLNLDIGSFGGMLSAGANAPKNLFSSGAWRTNRSLWIGVMFFGAVFVLGVVANWGDVKAMFTPLTLAEEYEQFASIYGPNRSPEKTAKVRNTTTKIVGLGVVTLSDPDGTGAHAAYCLSGRGDHMSAVLRSELLTVGRKRETLTTEQLRKKTCASSASLAASAISYLHVTANAIRAVEKYKEDHYFSVFFSSSDDFSEIEDAYGGSVPEIVEKASKVKRAVADDDDLKKKDKTKLMAQAEIVMVAELHRNLFDQPPVGLPNGVYAFRDKDGRWMPGPGLVDIAALRKN